MSNKLMRSLEAGANAAVIVAAISLSVVLIKTYVLSNPTRTALDSGGETVNLSNVDWAKNGHTLLLALSSTCHYCTESAPFYQRLAKESNTRRIAVLPEPVSEGKQYVEGLGLTVDEVRQVRLDSVGVRGTPTILLVNNAGVVTDSWIGVLSSEQEAEVLSRVQISRASK